MAVSTPHLGVDHPTVVPTNFHRERDDEASTDERSTGESSDQRSPSPSADSE